GRDGPVEVMLDGTALPQPTSCWFPGRGLDRSAHASQTASGMTPAFISRANALQPRQYPKIDSSPAATTMKPANTIDTPTAPKPNRATTAAMVKVAPMAWANRLGGPGVGFGSSGTRGTITRVASWPSGLNRGPEATRATNP